MAKEFRLAEVNKHNNNQSTWIVIHNAVYDVTVFLNEHPGGEEVLLEQAGKDGSEAFEDVGHSSDARELMKKYKIGEVVAEERTEVKEKHLEYSTGQNTDTNTSSFKSWILPLAIGLIATVLYRLYLSS